MLIFQVPRLSTQALIKGQAVGDVRGEGEVG